MNTSKGIQQFKKQPAEKQMLILQSALAEFADHGYDLASTNRIVEKAQISKGVLFKYFTNKEQLFSYILEGKLEKKLQWMTSDTEALPSDFFDILRWYTIREMAFFKNEPLFFKAFQHVSNQPQHPVYAKILKLSGTYSEEIVSKLVNGLPSAALREGVTVHKAFQFISWVFEGFKKQYVVDLDAPNWEAEAMAEVEQLFDMIKFGIYHQI